MRVYEPVYVKPGGIGGKVKMPEWRNGRRDGFKTHYRKV